MPHSHPSHPHYTAQTTIGPDNSWRSRQLPAQPSNAPVHHLTGTILSSQPREHAVDGAEGDDRHDDGDDRPDRQRRSTQPTLTTDEQAPAMPAEAHVQAMETAPTHLPLHTPATVEEPNMSDVTEADEDMEFEKRKKAKIDEYVAIWLWIVRRKKSLKGCRAQALGALTGWKRKRDGTE